MASKNAYMVEKAATHEVNILKLLEDDPSIFQDYDQISLIFLLCDNISEAANIIKEIIINKSSEQKCFAFRNWITQDRFKNVSFKWDLQFVEACSIIQNLKVPKLLGRSKEAETFLPHNLATSMYVCRVKKILYRLCESLTCSETERLVRLVETDKNCEQSDSDPQPLELTLLTWAMDKIISLEKKPGKMDLSVLIKLLKVFDLESMITDLQSAVDENNSYVATNVTELDSTKLSEDYEVIDKKCLGYCVILNEKHFYKTEQAELQSLVPDIEFETRVGTDKDVERLRETFAMFGFEVMTYTDLSYTAIDSLLTEYSQRIPETHSFFVLCILSHGSENVVYSSDSVPVNVETIELKFQGLNCPNLMNKPKIFIIQSCQGSEWQQVQHDSGVVRLGKQLRVVGPERGDSMVAWSTVKGFASFRDKFNGSWFIQELCTELWTDNDDDLVAKLMKVNNSLRSRTHEGQFMVPWLSLTLCKRIRFPKQNYRRLAGTSLMLERFAFDKYLTKYLINFYNETKNISHLDNIEM